MSRFVVAAVIASVVAAGSGCLVGELSGVPCRRDEQCPTAHFCDAPNEVCAAISDGDGAPDLVVVGVKDTSGAVVLSPFIEPGVESTVALVVENQAPPGGRAAEDVVVEMTELACLNLELDPRAAPETIAPGVTVEIEFAVRPVACGTPAIQDWFLFYSGRSKRGTFNFNLQRTPPSGD